MTSESASNTEPWIEEKGAEYPYAYDKGGRLKQQLGVTGIPKAFLVDPSGTIVWEGHPGNLKSEVITKHLDGVISRPLYDWPKSAAKIKAALLKNDFASAIAKAEKLGEKEEFGKEAAEFLRNMLSNRVDTLEAALEEGDVLTAYNAAKGLSKGVKGLPEAERIKTALKTITKDKELKGWLKTQQKVAEVLAEDMRRKKDCDEAYEQLAKLLKGNEGTFVGDSIEASMGELRKKASKLR